MNILKKCPVCNKKFSFKELVVSRGEELLSTKKTKGSICCTSCNSYLRTKHKVYRVIYIFLSAPFTVYMYPYTNINISNYILEMGFLLIIINALILLFDIIEHRFNRYIVDKNMR